MEDEVEGVFTLSSEDYGSEDDLFEPNIEITEIEGRDAVISALSSGRIGKALSFIKEFDIDEDSAGVIATHAIVLRYSTQNVHNKLEGNTLHDALEYVFTHLQDEYDTEIDSEYVFKEALRMRSNELMKWCISNICVDDSSSQLIRELSVDDRKYIESCDSEWLEMFVFNEQHTTVCESQASTGEGV